MTKQTENPVQQETAVSEDEAASLARIQAAVAAEEKMLTPPPAPAVEEKPAIPPNPKLTAELGGFIAAAVAGLSPMLPSLKEIYTDETIGMVASSVSVVCVKHGWLKEGIAGKYGEEVAAAFVLLPVAVATYKGVSADLAALAAKNKPQLPAPAAAPVPESSEPTAPAGAEHTPMTGLHLVQSVEGA